MTMNAKYPEGSLKLRDPENGKFDDAATGWANVLAGKALAKFYSRWVPKFAVRGRKQARSQQGLHKPPTPAIQRLDRPQA